jgi:hypothetical protein
MSEENRGCVERIVGAFLPDRLAGSYARLHEAGMVPKHEAEEFVGGPEMVKELTDRGLAHHAPHMPKAPASLRAVPLDVAMMLIVAEMKEEAIRSHQHLIQAYEKLSEVKSWPRTADGECRDHLVQVITDPEEIMRRSGTMINSAEREYMSLGTLDTGMPLTEDFVVSAAPVRREGLLVRAIYDQASVDHPVAFANIQRSMAAGEQARILPALPTKMLLIDKTAVLLPLNNTGTAGAVLFYAEPVVCGLADYFELLWSRAVPVGCAGPPPGCPLTKEQHDVLLLAQGLPHKAIQHKLDLGDRTLTRRVEAIMKALDTHSPFAAGAAAQRRGWLDGSGTNNG